MDPASSSKGEQERERTIVLGDVCSGDWVTDRGLPWSSSSCCHQLCFPVWAGEHSFVSVVTEAFTISSGKRNVTTARMISDANYFSSSNIKANNTAANSQINSCDCFLLANYQGGADGKPYQECSSPSKMLFPLLKSEEDIDHQAENRGVREGWKCEGPNGVFTQLCQIPQHLISSLFLSIQFTSLSSTPFNS
jgi:hypothetical protein